MQTEIILGLIELAKVSLHSYFSAMSLVGKNDAEIEALFLDEKRKFDENRPENLPDPVEGGKV
jgi:hypothetical protein